MGKREAFIARHEGFSSRAYVCPGGVVTIGSGLTNRCAVARDWWIARYGRKIEIGDTITRDENTILLKRALDDEYAPPVAPALGRDAPTHAHDAGCSVAYNCGPRSLTWKWAPIYRSGDRLGAASRLRRTAVTSRGRRLAGLVRRREEEANLLAYGDYGGAKKYRGARGFDIALKEMQRLLNKIGYPCGDADGIMGAKTIVAVKNLQRAHSLVVDGVIGPATRAKILRLANLRRETAGTTAAGGGTAGAGAVADPGADAAVVSQMADWAMYGGLIVLIAGLGYLAYFYRGEIAHWIRRP